MWKGEIIVDEEIRFQISCVTDYKAALTLYRVAGRTTQRGRYLARRLVNLLVGGFAVCVGLISLTAFGPGRIYGWFCLLAGLFLLLYGIFFYPFYAWRSMRLRPKRTEKEEESLIFKDEKFHAKGSSFEGIYDYSVVFGLYEWDHYLALFLDKGHGAILDEDTLTGGTPAELHQFLSEKTGLQGKKLH